MAKSARQIYQTDLNQSILKVTGLFWLIAKALSWRIWTTYRLYPLAPAFNWLTPVPGFVHLILLILSLLLITSLLFTESKFSLIALLFVELTSCALDQNRWQPWEYQYLFIIFIFIINQNKPKQIPAIVAFILICTYLYSGCGKLNDGFLQGIWYHMVLRSLFKLSANVAHLHWLYYSGYLLAAFELSGGLGLIFSKSRRLAAKGLILMHFLLLLFLGPLGLNYNKIVWPWNVAMMLYLYLIFIKKPESLISFKPVLTGLNKLVFLFWAILPALSFWGYWDGLLSSSIYSGKAPIMIICIKDTSKSSELKKFYSNTGKGICDGAAQINLQNWAMTETNVIPNPERRIYNIIEKKLQAQYPGAGFNFLIYVKGRKQ